jgi:hypothetical protein
MYVYISSAGDKSGSKVLCSDHNSENVVTTMTIDPSTVTDLASSLHTTCSSVIESLHVHK